MWLLLRMVHFITRLITVLLGFTRRPIRFGSACFNTAITSIDIWEDGKGDQLYKPDSIFAARYDELIGLSAVWG